MQWDRAGTMVLGQELLRGQDLVIASVNWEPKEGFVCWRGMV